MADNRQPNAGKSGQRNCCAPSGPVRFDMAANDMDCGCSNNRADVLPRNGCDCGGTGPLGNERGRQGSLRTLPMATAAAAADEPCCGPPPGPPSSPYARPGYTICRYVAGFVDTAVGPIPRVAVKLNFLDHLGTVRARLGFQRDRYRVAPGLYCIGNPGPQAVVLVTANYKLSFDSLRRELPDLDAWILVLDTRGVNVWCAAGKHNFSTAEVIKRVKSAGLDKVVSHRLLVLPQLAAPGVAAHKVKKGCGFGVQWGPVRAADIKDFLRLNGKTTPAMRQVTFFLGERLVLIPVELYLIMKPSFFILLAILLLSGIGPDLFSAHAAWSRGLVGAAAYGAALVAGAVAVPTLLPWLPSRKFFLKGIFTGLAAGGAVLFFTKLASIPEATAVLLLCMAVSSYAAMNFTGATPYTSPTGVEKEMRQGIPVQVAAVFVAAVAWLTAPFIGS
jgi:hypothetical protein